MRKRATIVTVADAAGVSVSTVSQVLRRAGRISPVTRRRVLSVARDLEYVHDRRAAAMRSGESHDVGLLIHNFANPFNAEVLSGINDALEAQEFMLFVMDTRDNSGCQNSYLRALAGMRPCGLIWVPVRDTDHATVEFVRANCPATVTFMRDSPGNLFDHVGVDNRLGGRMAARHLVGLGHRHIGFLGGDGNSVTIVNRAEGCAAELAAAKIAPPSILHCTESKEAAMQAMLELMECSPQMSAVVCSSDVVAMGATLALSRCGLTAGVDISLVGFDDLDDARLWTPPLTTIAVSPRRIGAAVASAFLERRRHHDAAPRRITLPISLKVRQSSGPYPAARGEPLSGCAL